MARSPYPLQWPEDSKRTHPVNRRRSMLNAALEQAEQELAR